MSWTHTDAIRSRRSAVNVARRLALFVCLVSVAALAAGAATFTAALDREETAVGDPVTLSLSFEGGSPKTLPRFPAVKNLNFSQNLGRSTQTSIINGRFSSSVIFTFQVTPTEAGQYTIPALSAVVDGATVSSQPLKLTAVRDPNDGAAPGAGGVPNAFLRLIVPRTNVYVGEVLPLEIQLFAQEGQLSQPPQLNEAGFTVGKISQQPQAQTRIRGSVFNVVPFKTQVAAARTGTLALGPATMNFTVPRPNARRDFFGRIADWHEIALTSSTQSVQVLPLPRQNVPASFAGAVGNYSLAYSVSPTNIAVGDPIQIKVQIAGAGAYESLSLPPQKNWREFKTFEPTSKTESSDPLGLQGSKSFELTIVPANTEVREVPPFEFSFFDPEQRAYRTLTQPAVPILVRPSAASVAPIMPVATSPAPPGETPPPAPELLPLKARPGMLGALPAPLPAQPWFLPLQAVPVLAWLGALTWRKRSEALAKNPRRRRQRQVAQVVRAGLQELQRLAGTDRSEEFFAALFRLLQEQLGERLDLPASAITEAVIEERLRPRGVGAETLAALHELFQACNQARYAPHRSAQELTSLAARTQIVLRELQALTE